MSDDPRTRIPAISKLTSMIHETLGEIPRHAAVALARLIADRLRADPGLEIADAITEIIEPLQRPGPREVVNATGILLHTNLGRAPLNPTTAKKTLTEVMTYTDLELDREHGERGHRDRHFQILAQRVWGVEDATLVNNAAAAVALALAALAGNREAVVSRGELVEIGGSFRLPDIMKLAGVHLVEVGTTNKTRLADYRDALKPDTGCMMKTHTSNYRIEGFTAEVALPELCDLGREHGVPVIMDLGSGLSRALPYPTIPEPLIEEHLEAKPDVLIFSGDKLFGGVQAGIVLGSHAAIQKLREHPLMRMLRLDKLAIALTCRQLTDAFLGVDHPLAKLARTTPAQLRARAEALCAKLGPPWRVIETHGFTGAGSLPQEQRPAVALVAEFPDLDAKARSLRLGDPPVIGYVRQKRLHINLAAVFPHQDVHLAARLAELKK